MRFINFDQIEISDPQAPSRFEMVLSACLGIGSVYNSHVLFGPPKNANGEEHRYYLLPGMGRANRQKRARIFWAAVIAGLVFSAIIAIVLYLVNRRGPSIFSPGE